MSTALHDLPTAAELVASVPPRTIEETTIGSAVDLVAADGPGFAIVSVGDLAASTVIAGDIEESATGTGGWVAIAAWPEINSANTTRVVRFQRTQRHVRLVIELTGPVPSATVCGLIGQQKKTV